MKLLALAPAIAFGATILVDGCTHGPTQPACADAGARPMLEYQLFFGRDIAGRPALTDREWADFAEQVVTAALPDGFTAFDADGRPR
jgi:Protein of unknown function (DUF3574)